MKTTFDFNQLLLTSLFIITLINVHAQEFAIKRFELASDKLIITYDLLDTVKNRHYTVNVFSSQDNFLNPLQKVSGDAGLEIAPGTNKKVIWNIAEEINPTFSGTVAVEIRGRVYIPFVRFTGFEDITARKRGVPFVITWSGGTRQNVLNFDLYKGDTKVWTQAGVGNTGNYEITIPKHVHTGNNYRFRISDSKNKDDVVYTSTFAVKPKIPFVIKALPVIALGAGAYFFLKGSGATPSAEKIADAPCPDGINCND